MITDDQGKLQTSYDYDAFGNALNTAQPNSTINHRYVGEYLDEDSGFYHLRARDYDPKIGRFISRDSFEGVKNNPITLNPCLYPNSDPVNGVDPCGLIFLSDVMGSLDIQSILASSAIRTLSKGIMIIVTKEMIYDSYSCMMKPLHFIWLLSQK